MNGDNKTKMHPKEVKSVTDSLEVSPSKNQADSPIGKMNPYPSGKSAVSRTAAGTTEGGFKKTKGDR